MADLDFTNANIFYPYWVNNFENWLTSSITTNSSPALNFSDPSTIPFEVMLGLFLDSTGNFTQDCSTALSWYNQSHLKAGDDASFGYGNEAINQEFTILVAPTFVGSLADDTDFVSLVYNLFANVSYPVGDAVFNITRPAIEQFCISKLLAEVQTVNFTQSCDYQLNHWNYPTYEDLDVVGEALAAWNSLPARYQNISIQTFWGWVNLEGLPSTDQIYARKQECFQSVCALQFSDSGNPDVVGIGMFISYIIEAVLATVIVLQTCWHNWKHRKVPLNTTTSTEVLRGRFVEATDTFLNNAIVFLLSLVVALFVVGLHETILYNGLITDLACYFAASALIAVASMPRRGSSQNTAFWIVLLFSVLVLIISTRLSGQYDFQAVISPDDLDPFGAGFALGYLENATYLGYSTGASEYLSQLNYTVPTGFSTSTCLVYGLIYANLQSYFINYLFASVFVQEIGYFGGLLLFFLFTVPPWPKQFIKRNKWVSRNFDTLIFWMRSMFCLFAWINMIMGLICMALWPSFEKQVTGQYYTEAQVEYGQVLALFLWAPVFATFVHIGAKQYSEAWEPKLSNIPFWDRRKKAPNNGIKSQNQIPATTPAASSSTPVVASNVTPNPPPVPVTPIPAVAIPTSPVPSVQVPPSIAPTPSTGGP